MRAWLRQHRLALGAAARKWRAQRAAALLNALALGVALALPAGGYVVLEAMGRLSTRSAIDPQLSVFMRTDAEPEAAPRLAAKLRGDARIHRVRLITRDEALASLRGTSGLADVVAALGSNPLPDTLVVTVVGSGDGVLDRLAEELGSAPGVALAQVDALWARRLAALERVGRLALALIAAVLAVGLVAIAFNTIRLQILTQRDEIEVSKLIGATDGFIQRPFLYLGLLQGLSGVLVALALVWAGVGLMNTEIVDLARTYGSAFRLPFFSPGEALALSLIAGALGWAGAYMSVSRYLREIEPK
ncbi:MAG: permease-like cell division protein FtsX [Burkholderiales bacterium]|nr:permease-like cell division protein FtsX [Burkholderiales bacterium]